MKQVFDLNGAGFGEYPDLANTDNLPERVSVRFIGSMGLRRLRATADESSGLVSSTTDEPAAAALLRFQRRG
jgi:hypothetical protein